MRAHRTLLFRALRWVAVSLVLATVCSHAFATPVGPRISERFHTHWSASDGAPTIRSIAQGDDGYLWLGTDHGLFYFDGISFKAFHLANQSEVLSREIDVVAVVPGGGLWIGYDVGGASFLKGGHLQTYSESDGLSGGAVRSFAVDPDGDVWAATDLGLVTFSHSRWKNVGTHWSYPNEYPDHLFMDSRGTLWTSTRTGLSALRRGETNFQELDRTRLQNVSFSEGPDGTVWLASVTGAVRSISTRAGQYLTHGVSYRYRSEGIHVDHDGALWITTVDRGLFRITDPQSGPNRMAGKEPQEQFQAQDGLTSDYAFAVMEGREGAIWVVTAKGLDQFREAPFKPIKLLPAPTYIAMVTEQTGALLIASERLSRVRDNVAIPIPGAPKSIECVYRDPSGIVWMGSSKHLWRYSRSHFTPVAGPPNLDRNQHVIQAITMDAGHALWVSYLNDGVYRFKDGEWQHSGHIQELSNDPAVSMLTDSKGSTWLGYLQNRVARIVDDHQVLYGSQEGLHIGMVSTIAEAHNRIWVGGTGGLQFYDQGQFRFLGISGHDNLSGVSGIVADTNGDLWLNTADGVFHVPEREFAQALVHPSYQVHAVQFNYLDGLTGSPDQLHHLPTVVRAGDGTLYFAIQGSVVRLAPNELTKNLLPPPVWIRSVAADGNVFAAPTTITLPVRTRSLVIDYTATSLLVPQRVQFRYKLDGIDKEWQDAGTRREALYSRLPPGHYHFHVIASNNDNVWNDTGADFAFTVPPAFTQSIGFYVLCGVAFMALLWGIYLTRIRQVTRQIKSQLDTRVSERERIARDLHDTFLQGVQALFLSFHTATKHMNGDERSRSLLEAAFQQSDEVMQEGRALVLNLRGEATEGDELPQSLAVVGQQFSKGHASAFTLIVTGHVYPVQPIMRDEVYRIAREALANAFKHAAAEKVEVDIVYGEKELLIRIRDNGIGIDPTVVTAGSRKDHWGLPGMRERASVIGAELHLWSRLKAGTEVELKIPALLASPIHQKNRPLRSSLFRDVEEKR